MFSQKVVLEECRFGMLGQRLEGEQALTTSSPCVLCVSLAAVPAEAAPWVRGWGCADVSAGLGWVVFHTFPVPWHSRIGGDTGIPGMVCTHEGTGGLFAALSRHRSCGQQHGNLQYSDKLL